MKYSFLPVGFAAANILFSLAAGCGSGGGTTTYQPLAAASSDPSPVPTATPSPSPTPVPIDAPISTTRRYQNLVLTLSTPHSVYKAWDTAHFTLTVQNTGNGDISAAAAPLFIGEADYLNASSVGMTAISGSARLFPVETVFKAGETVTLPIDEMLTGFTQPLTYRVFRVSVETGSLTNPNTLTPGTDAISLTVL